MKPERIEELEKSYARDSMQHKPMTTIEVRHLLRCARAWAELEANIHIDEVTASRLIGGGWAVDFLIACELQGDSRAEDLLTATEAALARAKETT